MLPVSDVDKAKDFYQALGWRLDANYSGGPDYCVVQLTPPPRSAPRFDHCASRGSFRAFPGGLRFGQGTCREAV